MTYFDKFNEVAKGVVLYNAAQRKVAPFSDIDILQQTQRVEEEVKELLGRIENIKKEGMSKKLAIGVMDDVCDIAVTLSFLVHMQNEVPVPYHREVKDESGISILSHLASIRMDALGLGKFIAITEKLNSYPEVIGCSEFDVLGGFEAVNENNISKLIDTSITGLNDSEIDSIVEATIAKYPNDEIEVVESADLGYIAFQRKSDNKNMKPSTFKDVNLKSFVEVL